MKVTSKYLTSIYTSDRSIVDIIDIIDIDISMIVE